MVINPDDTQPRLLPGYNGWRLDMSQLDLLCSFEHTNLNISGINTKTMEIKPRKS
jgi:hypothetical protein